MTKLLGDALEWFRLQRATRELIVRILPGPKVLVKIAIESQPVRLLLAEISRADGGWFPRSSLLTGRCG